MIQNQLMIKELSNTLKKYNFDEFQDEIFNKINSLGLKDETLINDIIRFVNGIILSEERNLPEKYEKRYFQETLNDYKIRDTIAEIIGLFYRKYKFKNESGLLGQYNQLTVNNIVSELNKKGYHIFESRLNENICDKILESLQKIKFVERGKNGVVTGLDFENAQANTYWPVKQKDIINIPEIQELLMDPTILNVVQDYLKCGPINTQATIWWSINFQDDEEELKRSAQMFHQDLSHVKFVKALIYLNDVDENSGPHVYVPGSVQNLKLPLDYTISQRVSDEFIYEKYGKENVKVMTGKKGTILFEDTSGWHKGQPVVNGKRIILNLEFCVSFFNGVTEETITWGLKGEKNLGKKFVQFMKDYPRLCKKYFDEEQHDEIT